MKALLKAVSDPLKNSCKKRIFYMIGNVLNVCNLVVLNKY